MFDSRNVGSGLPVDSFAGLLELGDNQIGYGYYDSNEIAAAPAVAWNTRTRTGAIGWWNRHRTIQAAVGMTMVLTIGFLPATQNAILSVITHAG
ncbi:hypothetical protein [Nocardia arthritidis]|uniref:Uncharacterized protein n=1 Tax=Nocardia arthritidis TaxID=228602 RepID=A0A6G9YBL9_9NOCA|nr:hypothetical protein [Nocardia arthritidis]QIS10530.1 hypothetical protein F5544_13205 [Nocardia arthritidis]